MSTQSNSVNELAVASRAAAQTVISPGRRLYWSVRREVWENRGVFLAPAAAAAFVILGIIIAVSRGAIQFNVVVENNGTVRHLNSPAGADYTASVLVIMGVSFLAAVFYCLGALHGERNDRSILFWKSLPVSDLTTVLGKVAIPTAVLPAFTMALIVATQLVILLIHVVVQVAGGQGVASAWADVNLPQVWLMALYRLVAIHVLWYAPIYGYALVVSAWAKRAPILWAILPPVFAGIVEKIAYGTSNVFMLLNERLSRDAGGTIATAGSMVANSVEQMTPLHFLANPGLWLGLVFAVLCLTAAVRLRRWRGII
jgi:ABC-2 type transport system permease protein